MKLNIIYTSLIILSGINLIAQELPKVVPLSPEASSIFKFNEIPVSLHNGTHNTTIPLLDLSHSGVSLPITLSYHSQGVLVSDVASRVGTGWTLNYGGMISRQIRGIADETANGYFSNSNSTFDFYLNYNKRLAESNNESDKNQDFDHYPDRFMINSNFYSGDFYFDKNNDTILTKKFSDIKIKKGSFNEFGYKSFEVTDNLGNKYLFGDENASISNTEREHTVTSFIVPSIGSVSYGNNSYSKNSSWNIRKIETANKETIDFTYENELIEITRRTGDINNQYSGNYQSGDPLYTCTFNVNNSYQNVIKEITYKYGKVKFISATNIREDLAGGHVLDRIEQYDINNQLIKLIKFNYFYTTANTNNSNINNYILNTDTRSNKRLFLESIILTYTLNGIEEKYSFEYDSQVLPNRHCNEIDAYGYYNGKNRGTFLKIEDVGGNSSVDSVKMQAGILKRITYPTGGSTVFEYEPNLVDNTLPNNIKYPNPNPVINSTVVLSIIEPEKYNFSSGRYEKTFTVSNVTNNHATSSITLSNPNDFTCRLLNNDSNTSVTLTQGTNYNVGIGNGNYTLIVDPRGSTWNPYPDPENPNFLLDNNFVVSLQYSAYTIDFQNTIYGPGNRIKKITNFSANDKEEFSRVYEYKNDANNISGYLLSVSNYMVSNPNFPPNLNVYYHTPNIAGGRFSSYNKDNISYSQVNEYFVSNTNDIKDKTSYYYSLIPDFGSYSFPNHLFNDSEWLRGKEIKKIQYKKVNNSFIPVQKIENDYKLYGSTSLSTMYPFMYPIENYIPLGYEEILLPLNQSFESAPSYIPRPYMRSKTKFCYPTSTNTYDTSYRTSILTGGTLDLYSTKVTDYFENDTFVENETTYQYDYANHYNVAQTTITNSTNDLIQTNYYYAANTNNAALIDKNMLGIPLKTEIKRNGDKVSTQETIYKDWGNNLLAPEIIKTAKGNDNTEVRIRYNQVDSTNSNPLEVQQENGMVISYIWGYSKTQPVAKLENIAYATIPSSHIQAIETASNEANLKSALTALRNDPVLANAMVTTYTYKPLVGVSSITDPKGNTITYHYDSFGRLEFVKDSEGNILSENKYHYRTQN